MKKLILALAFILFLGFSAGATDIVYPAAKSHVTVVKTRPHKVHKKSHKVKKKSNKVHKKGHKVHKKHGKR